MVNLLEKDDSLKSKSFSRTSVPTTYLYSDEGHRQTTITGAEVTQYVWDEDIVLLEIDNTEGTRTQYTQGSGEWGMLVSQQVNTTVTYLGSDDRNNVRLLLPQAGTGTGANYKAFGSILPTPGTPATPFQYGGNVGYYAESPTAGVDDTEFYRTLHRIYRFHSGRFPQPDPTGINGGYNLYGYANNNPISWIDPSGQAPLTMSQLSQLNLYARHPKSRDAAWARNQRTFGSYAIPFVKGAAEGAAVGLATGFIVATFVPDTAIAAGILVGVGVVGLGYSVYHIATTKSRADRMESIGELAGGVLVGGNAFKGLRLRVEFRGLNELPVLRGPENETALRLPGSAVQRVEGHIEASKPSSPHMVELYHKTSRETAELIMNEGVLYGGKTKTPGHLAGAWRPWPTGRGDVYFGENPNPSAFQKTFWGLSPEKQYTTIIMQVPASSVSNRPWGIRIVHGPISFK
jgi:RHS repeat-associated protein